MQDESTELYQTVREVRESKFPGLDATLVEEILSIQVRFSSDSVEAKKSTEKALNTWAASQVDKEDLNADAH